MAGYSSLQSVGLQDQPDDGSLRPVLAVSGLLAPGMPSWGRLLATGTSGT